MEADKPGVFFQMAQQLRALYVGVLAEVALVRLVCYVSEHVTPHHFHCVSAVPTLKHSQLLGLAHQMFDGLDRL